MNENSDNIKLKGIHRYDNVLYIENVCEGIYLDYKSTGLGRLFELGYREGDLIEVTGQFAGNVTINAAYQEPETYRKFKVEEIKIIETHKEISRRAAQNIKEGSIVQMLRSPYKGQKAKVLYDPKENYSGTEITLELEDGLSTICTDATNVRLV